MLFKKFNNVNVNSYLRSESFKYHRRSFIQIGYVDIKIIITITTIDNNSNAFTWNVSSRISKPDILKNKIRIIIQNNNWKNKNPKLPARDERVDRRFSWSRMQYRTLTQLICWNNQNKNCCFLLQAIVSEVTTSLAMPKYSVKTKSKQFEKKNDDVFLREIRHMLVD